MFLRTAILFKGYEIVFNIIVLLHSFTRVTSFSWLEMVYKNYKNNCKLFRQPMEKISIILWNVWIHINQVVFKKVQPNPFLIIEKTTLTFQNLQEYLCDPYLHNKGRKTFQRVENGFDEFPLLMVGSN